jgi:hypothetical protein
MSVKLSSQEGEEFEVPVELAKLSETVKHIMEGIAIPLVLFRCCSESRQILVTTKLFPCRTLQEKYCKRSSIIAAFM